MDVFTVLERVTAPPYDHYSIAIHPKSHLHGFNQLHCQFVPLPLASNDFWITVRNFLSFLPLKETEVSILSMAEYTSFSFSSVQI